MALREEASAVKVRVERRGYCVPSFISLITSLCHQLIICAWQGSDTLDSLHAGGERRQDDDTADRPAGRPANRQAELTEPPDSGGC